MHFRRRCQLPHPVPLISTCHRDLLHHLPLVLQTMCLPQPPHLVLLHLLQRRQVLEDSALLQLLIMDQLPLLLQLLLPTLGRLSPRQLILSLDNPPPHLARLLFLLLHKLLEDSAQRHQNFPTLDRRPVVLVDRRRHRHYLVHPQIRQSGHLVRRVSHLRGNQVDLAVSPALHQQAALEAPPQTMAVSKWVRQPFNAEK